MTMRPSVMRLFSNEINRTQTLAERKDIPAPKTKKEGGK